jgi:membrane fusion protein (multidrug efflux system)
VKSKTGSPVKSKTTSPGSEDIDESPSLARKQVLHRLLRSDTGQDYFVYVPESAGRDAPLLVAMHDISRNARQLADTLAAPCERYGVILVVPHFSVERHPNYQRLGTSRAGETRGKRSNDYLDSIVEEVGSMTGVSTARIHLFGYAAGGRFAMRYAIAHPERAARVAIASPGTYTYPNPQRRFPQGIGRSSRRPDLKFDPERFLRVPMTLFEEIYDGEGERPPKLEGVGKGPRAVARKSGKKWVAAMNATAKAGKLTSVVSYQKVEGTPDSFSAFAKRKGVLDSVFDSLFGATRSASATASLATVPGADRLPADEAREPSSDEEAAPASRREQLRRLVFPVVLVTALVAFAAPVILWARYQSTHVVSRDAVVRGHIADVGVRLDGVVKSMEVDTGDRIRAGQIVARLEDSHFQARMRQARSRLEKAVRELEVERLAILTERRRLDSSLNEVAAGLSAAEADKKASESRADEAARRLDVQKSLARKGLVAEERVRTAETELRTAQAITAASHANKEAALAAQQRVEVESEGLSVRQKRVSVLESEVSAIQAELQVAEADLEGAVIRAPDNGAVVRRIVEPGASIVVGQPILSLWLGEDTWVEAWIDEDDLAYLAVGNEATVALKSYPDREFTGVVESIGVSTDLELPDSEVPQPRHERMRDAPVISVRVRLDETEEALFPGLSAVVGIRKKAD